MKLAKLIKGLSTRRIEGPVDLEVRDITDDSRTVKRGGLFIAVRGHAVDGSKFIDCAVASGAKIVVSEKDFRCSTDVLKILVYDSRAAMNIIAGNFYGHPSSKLKTVGITGTNGKTTITYMIESMIKAAGKDAGVIGTINYRVKGKVVPANNTTPGAIVLQKMLADMVRLKAGYAIMEVSSHSLAQGRIDGILLDVGLFTNITSDHLDYHKTTANYFRAKKKLFEKLKSGGTAILNMDDRKVASLKRTLVRRVVTFSVKRRVDVIPQDICISMDGSRFNVITPRGKLRIRTKLIGMHNISNILAAIAAGCALKLPLKAMESGIAAVKRVPGRLEAVDADQPFKVFVDFAHTEDALLNVLSMLRGVARKRIVTVFGCGGDRDRTKRPLMGRVACRYSDHVIVTSDNPRFEDPDRIIDEIESGIKGLFSNYDIVEDRKEAISKALGIASEGDIIVIAGKGHENYQIIRDKVTPFDDREVAMSILKKGRSSR